MAWLSDFEVPLTIMSPFARNEQDRRRRALVQSATEHNLMNVCGGPQWTALSVGIQNTFRCTINAGHYRLGYAADQVITWWLP
jgi:hypothetical protein